MLLVDQTLYSCSESEAQVVRKVKSSHTMALLPASQAQITAVLHNALAKQTSLQIQSVDWSLKEDDMDTAITASNSVETSSCQSQGHLVSVHPSTRLP